MIGHMIQGYDLVTWRWLCLRGSICHMCGYCLQMRGKFTIILAFQLRKRLRGELIKWESSRRPSMCLSVRPCVCVFTLSNMNTSETNGSNATKFYLKHHWVGDWLH